MSKKIFKLKKKFVKLNLINLSNLFYKFVKLLTRTVRAAFHLAMMLCVSFTPFAHVFFACFEKPCLFAKY